MKKEYFSQLLIFSLWIITVVAIFRSFLFPLFDPDLWWHLASGRAMVEQHQFLKTELFSHSLTGIPWTNFEWLFEVTAFAIYWLGGFSGLYWAKIIFCLAVVGVFIASLRRAGSRGPSLILFTWIGFLDLRPRLFERPELVTYLLMGIFVWWILRLRSDPDRSSRSFTAGIFILMIIWVNAHAGFVYGLSLLFCFDLGARWARAEPLFIASLDRALTLSLVAVVISPHGIKIGSLLTELMIGFSQYRGVIQEWGAASVMETPYFWGLYIAVVVGIVAVFYQKKSSFLFWFPSLVLFGLWGASSYRNTPLFVFPAMPFLIEVIGAPRSASPGFHRTIKMTMWAACFVAVISNLSLARLSFPQEKVAWEKFPRGAANFLRSSSIQGRMYNTYRFGGYLEWALPEQLIFKDGRYPFFPLEQEERNLNLSMKQNFSDRPWQEYLKRWGIDYAVVEYPTAFFHLVNHGTEMDFPLPVTSLMFPRQFWALVYWDDAALVFVKRNRHFERFIQTQEYKTIRPYSQAQMLVLLEKKLISVADLEKDVRRQEGEVGSTKIGNDMQKLVAWAKNRSTTQGAGLKNRE